MAEYVFKSEGTIGKFKVLDTFYEPAEARPRLEETTNSVIFFSEPFRFVIYPAIDKVIINLVPYDPGSLSVSALSDLLNVLFHNANSGTGGSGNNNTDSEMYRQINSAQTTQATDRTIEITGGAFDLTLISAAGRQGIQLRLANSGNGTIRLVPAGTEQIMGQTSVNLPAGTSIILESNGTNYIILATFP